MGLVQATGSVTKKTGHSNYLILNKIVYLINIIGKLYLIMI